MASIDAKYAEVQQVMHAQAHLKQPISLSDLAAAIPIPQAKTDNLRRLMLLLVHSGIFSLSVQATGENHALQADHAEPFHALTPSSSLAEETGESLSAFVLMMLDSYLMNPWQFFADWFETDGGVTPFKLCHGEEVWELAESSPEFNGKFNAAMASDARMVMSAIVARCPAVFEGLGSLVDVGGGTGRSTRSIADAFPGLKVTVLDLPHVVAGLLSTPAVDFVGGDMFDRIPLADAVFL